MLSRCRLGPLCPDPGAADTGEPEAKFPLQVHGGTEPRPLCTQCFGLRSEWGGLIRKSGGRRGSNVRAHAFSSVSASFHLTHERVRDAYRSALILGVGRHKKTNAKRKATGEVMCGGAVHPGGSNVPRCVVCENERAHFADEACPPCLVSNFGSLSLTGAVRSVTIRMS